MGGAGGGGGGVSPKSEAVSGATGGSFDAGDSKFGDFNFKTAVGGVASTGNSASGVTPWLLAAAAGALVIWYVHRK